jgi:DNA-binding NarL/FixJ family response regulator
VRALTAGLAANIEPESLKDTFLRRVEDLLPERPPTGLQAAKLEFDGLTAREREVAALVARGLTNREIAERLVVSERTAEAHVGNLLRKLDFSSRAQVGAWAAEKGLLD